MFHSPQVPRQAEAAQLGTHTQHCPLPTLHGPADDVTVQGADTLVSKTASLQSHVSPHTATVLVTAHTQHSPLPTSQLPVDDRTEHIALSLLTSAAVPQSQVSPQTAIVRVCVIWRRVAGGSGPSSPPRTPCAQVGMASTSISTSTSQVHAHGRRRSFPCMSSSSRLPCLTTRASVALPILGASPCRALETLRPVTGGMAPRTPTNCGRGQGRRQNTLRRHQDK